MAPLFRGAAARPVRDAEVLLKPGRYFDTETRPENPSI